MIPEAPQPSKPEPARMIRKLCTECSRKIEVPLDEFVCLVCDGPLVDIPPEKKVKVKKKKINFKKLNKRDEALKIHFRQMISSSTGAKRESLLDEFIRRFLKV